jgi:hypothetical protein
MATALGMMMAQQQRRGWRRLRVEWQRLTQKMPCTEPLRVTRAIVLSVAASTLCARLRCLFRECELSDGGRHFAGWRETRTFHKCVHRHHDRELRMGSGQGCCNSAADRPRPPRHVAPHAPGPALAGAGV